MNLATTRQLAEPVARKYTETHPWLTFSADLTAAPYPLWLLLGEARSKVEHIAGVPLRPETADELHRMYLAKGALATTAIEGNTLSEQQVLDHLEGKLQLPPSQQYLAKEIDNIIAGCNQILRQIFIERDTSLSPDKIREFNRQVLEELNLEEGVVPGEYRTHAVRVAQYLGAPPEDCDYLVDELCTWLNHRFDPPRDDLKLPFAVMKAILAHLYLAWIHPFGDGNGRTARMVEVQILVAAGVPTPAAHLLSNHYNQTRSEYYVQLDRASRSGGDVVPFLIYAVQGFVDGLMAQVANIREQQWDVAWENYVHDAFGAHKGPSRDRQRRLVLDLSDARKTLARSQIRELTPRLAAAYASKTDKTLSRDLNALLSMKLITQDRDGYKANREMILAFLPRKTAATPAGSASSLD